MNFLPGDPGILASFNERLASCYGKLSTHPDIVQGAGHRAIAERLIQQYKAYPEAFERAMRDYGADSDGLRREAQELDLPFYTFAYGVPVHVAKASANVLSSSSMSMLFLLGDVEEEPWDEMLVYRRSVSPGWTVQFDQAIISLPKERRDEYGVRSYVFSRALGKVSAYGLMRRGARAHLIPNANFDSGRLMESVLLGTDINYALSAYQGHNDTDPRAVYRAYQDSVPVEYLLATL